MALLLKSKIFLFSICFSQIPIFSEITRGKCIMKFEIKIPCFRTKQIPLIFWTTFKVLNIAEILQFKVEKRHFMLCVCVAFLTFLGMKDCS